MASTLSEFAAEFLARRNKEADKKSNSDSMTSDASAEPANVEDPVHFFKVTQKEIEEYCSSIDNSETAPFYLSLQHNPKNWKERPSFFSPQEKCPGVYRYNFYVYEYDFRNDFGLTFETHHNTTLFIPFKNGFYTLSMRAAQKYATTGKFEPTERDCFFENLKALTKYAHKEAIDEDNDYAISWSSLLNKKLTLVEYEAAERAKFCPGADITPLPLTRSGPAVSTFTRTSVHTSNRTFGVTSTPTLQKPNAPDSDLDGLIAQLQSLNINFTDLLSDQDLMLATAMSLEISEERVSAAVKKCLTFKGPGAVQSGTSNQQVKQEFKIQAENANDKDENVALADQKEKELAPRTFTFNQKDGKKLAEIKEKIDLTAQSFKNVSKEVFFLRDKIRESEFNHSLLFSQFELLKEETRKLKIEFELAEKRKAEIDDKMPAETREALQASYENIQITLKAREARLMSVSNQGKESHANLALLHKKRQQLMGIGQKFLDEYNALNRQEKQLQQEMEERYIKEQASAIVDPGAGNTSPLV